MHNSCNKLAISFRRLVELKAGLAIFKVCQVSDKLEKSIEANQNSNLVEIVSVTYRFRTEPYSKITDPYRTRSY